MHTRRNTSRTEVFKNQQTSPLSANTMGPWQRGKDTQTHTHTHTHTHTQELHTQSSTHAHSTHTPWCLWNWGQRLTPHSTHYTIKTHAHSQGHTHSRTHAHMHAHTHTRTHTRTHAHTHTRTHIRTHTHTHVHPTVLVTQPLCDKYLFHCGSTTFWPHSDNIAFI